MSSINDASFDGSAESSEFIWRGEQALKRVHALNERCLELLGGLARRDSVPSLSIVRQHRRLWRALNATARKNAACTPFLLVDAHFKDANWWRSAKDSRSGIRRKRVLYPAFEGKVASGLMRETLMLAWSTVALDRGAASVLLGMTPSVRRIIAELAPQDVERIAARHSSYLRPRWEDFPGFWEALLTAAREGDEVALHDVHLHGLQLLGSELLPLLDSRSA